MDKSVIIKDLRYLNQSYGERANKAFDRGDYDKRVALGQRAEVYGAAARELENGASTEEVNEKWNGILDF